MFEGLFKACIAGVSLIALPGAAFAGTSASTGTASLSVTNQCSVSGATVNLGTFTVNNTWGDVAASLGLWVDGGTPARGSRGTQYLTFGSITCDAGTPYELDIRGSSLDPNSAGAIEFTHAGKVAKFFPFVTTIGSETIYDEYPAEFPGGGLSAGWANIPGTGSGTAQPIMGNVVFFTGVQSTTAGLTDKLGTPAVLTDTLYYGVYF